MSAPQRPELNWQRCAELHNLLLETGWVPVHRETDWVQDETPWWEENFGENTDTNSILAAELEERLQPSVVKFLQAVKNDYPGNECDENLFYYISELITPEEMLKSLNQDKSIFVPDNKQPIAVLPTLGRPMPSNPEVEVPDITDNRFIWLYQAPGAINGGT